METSTVPKSIFIDSRLESYRSFFDFDWAKQLLESASGSVLEAPAMSLCAGWRGAANTHAMPWIAFTMFKGFAEGLATTHEPFGMKWIKETRNRLVRELRGELSHTKIKILSDALERIFDDLKTEIEHDPYTVDLTEIWDPLVGRHELQMAIWQSQRLCYSALYFAYEDFIVQCIGVARSNPSFKAANAAEVTKALETTFGNETSDFCWTDQDVENARLVRNCLAHSGGRISEKLALRRHGLKEIDGELQITATNTGALHNLLKERVVHLVAKFRSSATARS